VKYRDPDNWGRLPPNSSNNREVSEAMTPFILLARRRLPPEAAPSDDHVYDGYQQLWLSRQLGTPLVLSMLAQNQASRFGETTVTETREGTDQSEVASLSSSLFGETTLTKTVEGVDQPEAASVLTSEFGETSMSRSIEGADQQEVTALQNA
jgi:hypothetical protein